MMRPDLYVFSPLPPARNGIADYSAAVMDALEPYYRCIGVVADDAPAPSWREDVTFLFLSEYRRIAASVAEERHLFQLGNNAGHAYLLPWLERVSGVLTLHDATMAHALDWIATSNGVGTPAYLRLADAAHGPDGAELLAESIASGLWQGAMGQELGFLGPILKPARAVIVHSRLARQRALAADPAATVHVIPHFAEGKGAAPRPEPRRNGPLRLLCLGFPSRAKRLDLVLGALRVLRDHGVPAVLTIAGEVRPEEVDVQAEVEALGLEAAVTITGYVSEDRMAALLSEADVVVNLRDPTSGESSGTLARALAAGVCVVVTNIGSYAEFPQGTVIKLAKAEMTIQGLAQTLARVALEPDLRRETGERGRAHVMANCRLDQVADAYRYSIEEAYASPAKRLSAETALNLMPPTQMPGIEVLARDTGTLASPYQLWWREALLPLAETERSLHCIGVDRAVAAMIQQGWGWLAEESAEANAGLALIDEAQPAEITDRLRAIEGFVRRLPPGGCLTVEVANEAYLQATITRLILRHGLRVLRQAHGPSLPLVTVRDRSWLPSGWAATFVRRATPLPSAQFGCVRS